MPFRARTGFTASRSSRTTSADRPPLTVSTVLRGTRPDESAHAWRRGPIFLDRITRIIRRAFGFE
jgi:hypothetical protein